MRKHGTMFCSGDTSWSPLIQLCSVAFRRALSWGRTTFTLTQLVTLGMGKSLAARKLWQKLISILSHFFCFNRENQFRFLPAHVARSTSWSWLPYSRQTSAEVRLLEQFKRVPTTATTRKLMRKYLEFCWALPFYG